MLRWNHTVPLNIRMRPFFSNQPSLAQRSPTRFYLVTAHVKRARIKIVTHGASNSAPRFHQSPLSHSATPPQLSPIQDLPDVCPPERRSVFFPCSGDFRSLLPIPCPGPSEMNAAWLYPVKHRLKKRTLSFNLPALSLLLAPLPPRKMPRPSASPHFSLI